MYQNLARNFFTSLKILNQPLNLDYKIQKLQTLSNILIQCQYFSLELNQDTFFSGAVETKRYQVGNQNHENVTSEKQPIVWFVDTTEWNLAFESDSNGNVTKGTKETLIKKIRAGAAVRCVMRNEAGVIPLPSLVITKKGVVGALAPSNIEVNYVCILFVYFPYLTNPSLFR